MFDFRRGEPWEDPYGVRAAWEEVMDNLLEKCGDKPQNLRTRLIQQQINMITKDAQSALKWLQQEYTPKGS